MGICPPWAAGSAPSRGACDGQIRQTQLAVLDQCLLVVGRWVPEYLRGVVDRPLPRRWGEWPHCRHHVFPGGGGWYFLNAWGALDCGPGSPVVATRRHRRSHPALDRWTVRDVLVAGNLEAARSPYRPGGIDFSIASGHSRSLPGKCPAPVGRMWRRSWKVATIIALLQPVGLLVLSIALLLTMGFASPR